MESKIFPTVRCAQDIVGVLAKYHTPVAMIDEVLATAKDIAETSTIVTAPTAEGNLAEVIRQAIEEMRDRETAREQLARCYLEEKEDG